MQDDFKKRLADNKEYIEFLEDYGRDWFAFLPHHKFYTQASWFAFRQIITKTIEGRPLTKGEAEAAFKSNGAALLEVAIKAGLVTAERKANIKAVDIVASDELITSWLDHIERTRCDLRRKLDGNNK